MPTEPLEGHASSVEAENLAEGDASFAEDQGAVESEASFAKKVEEREEGEEDEKERRRLLFLLVLLLALLLCVGTMFLRYLQHPEPLPEMLPLPVEVNYPPHYLFSIYGVDKPVGVAVSPRSDFIYAAETSGERLIKVFDRDGDPIDSFAPPRTRPQERSPVYLDTDDRGRVFVTDRLQHAVFVYDRVGAFLDTILSPDLTLSEYVSKHVDGLQTDATLAFNVFEAGVYYQRPGEAEQTFPAPDSVGWSPLGICIDGTGKMLLTDVVGKRHTVREFPAQVVQAASWREFDPLPRTFGDYGQSNGQFLFPNAAVTDAQGRVYVTDGNNGRISVWDGERNFLYNFGQGAGDGALSLPRGAAIDERDRLYVVDVVRQGVEVYDVSGPEPRFLFAFGDWGGGDGEFNYPNDIALDTTGRLYIADRENNRIQVWSY